MLVVHSTELHLMGAGRVRTGGLKKFEARALRKKSCRVDSKPGPQVQGCSGFLREGHFGSNHQVGKSENGGKLYEGKNCPSANKNEEDFKFKKIIFVFMCNA